MYPVYYHMMFCGFALAVLVAIHYIRRHMDKAEEKRPRHIVQDRALVNYIRWQLDRNELKN